MRFSSRHILFLSDLQCPASVICWPNLTQKSYCNTWHFRTGKREKGNYHKSRKKLLRGWKWVLPPYLSPFKTCSQLDVNCIIRQVVSLEHSLVECHAQSLGRSQTKVKEKDGGGPWDFRPGEPGPSQHHSNWLVGNASAILSNGSMFMCSSLKQRQESGICILDWKYGKSY